MPEAQIATHKYGASSDPTMNMQENFLALSNFQQWVLFQLYDFKRHRGTASVSVSDLILETCPSAIPDEFGTDEVTVELGVLIEKGLIIDAEDGGCQITDNGTMLVKWAAHKIHAFVRDPVDAILKQISDTSVKKSIQILRDNSQYADAANAVRKIIQIVISNTDVWVTLISLMVSGTS